MPRRTCSKTSLINVLISETFMRGLAQLLYNTMDKLLRVPVMQFTAYPDVLQSLNSLFRTRYKGVEPKREKRHFSAFFDWSVLSMRMQVILDSLLFNPILVPEAAILVVSTREPWR